MLEPVHIENEEFLVHTFRAEDIKKEKVVSKDILAILSDGITTHFLPGKKLATLKEAELFFRGNLLNYYAGKNYLHLITDKQTHKVIGMIDLISPSLAREHYRMDACPYFVEFYLKSEFQHRGIMGELLPAFVKQLQQKNIQEIGAVINRDNKIAQKVILKTGFRFSSEFDFAQDFYTITLN